MFPEDLGDVVGLVVLARGDAAGDRGVADVDAFVAQGLVEHPRVGDLAGEGDADPGALRVGLDRGTAGGEEDRAGARLHHRPDHRERRRPPPQGGAAACAPSMRNSTGPRMSSTLVSRIGFMNSFAGSGEYSSTSTGPSRPARSWIAAVSAPASRMSAAAYSTVSPSSARRPSASAASFSALREIRPTA